MNAADLDKVSAAMAAHTEEVNAANQRLSQALKSIEGATEALRRFLATKGMNAEQISQILACDVRPSALPALLNVMPPKN